MADVVAPGPGDIGLVRIRGAEGRLIRVGQWLLGNGYADFEHAFVMVSSTHLVEAEPAGAREVPLSEYGWAQVVWLRCPDQYRAAVAQQAQTFVGVPYGFADYLALAAHRFRLPVPGLRAFIGDTHSMICSQLAVAAARRGGWEVLSPEWDGYVTPGALYELAEGTMKKGFS